MLGKANTNEDSPRPHSCIFSYSWLLSVYKQGLAPPQCLVALAGSLEWSLLTASTTLTKAVQGPWVLPYGQFQDQLPELSASSTTSSRM